MCSHSELISRDSDYSLSSEICRIKSSSMNYQVFLSTTEYHSNADYNSRQVGVFVVIVVVVHTFKNGLAFERLYQFASVDLV